MCPARCSSLTRCNAVCAGEVAAHLQEAGVGVRPYGDVLADVKALAAGGTRIWMDPSRVGLLFRAGALRLVA